jgi:hypothetical protein
MSPWSERTISVDSIVAGSIPLKTFATPLPPGDAAVNCLAYVDRATMIVAIDEGARRV